MRHTLLHRPGPWLKLDASYATSRARFTDDDPAGNRIPGAVEGVFSGGVTVHELHRWSRQTGEPLEGIDDIHTHPAAPRTFRIGLAASF